MRTLATVIFACAALLLACQEGKAASNNTRAALAAPAAATTATPLGDPSGGARYTVVARAVELKVGGKLTTELRIEPAEGLKYNKDFPSKFVVNAGRHAKCDKEDLTKRAGDVKMDGKVGVVSIPLSGIAAGTGSLSIMGNFSLCNDEQCFVLRGEQLSLQVTVK